MFRQSTGDLYHLIWINFEVISTDLINFMYLQGFPIDSSQLDHSSLILAHQEPGYEARYTVEYTIDLISLFG